MTISERIIKVRTDAGLNQVEFAKRLSLSKQTISNYETGSRQPGLDIILKISDEFNISTDYLLGKSDYKTLESDKLSALILHVLDINIINKFGSFTNEDLDLLGSLFLSGGFDILISALVRYHNLSQEEINEYGKLVYGENSNLFKMKNFFNKGSLKKKMLSPVFDAAVSDLLNKLDTIEELDMDEKE